MPKKPFWDVDEVKDFNKVDSRLDGLPYKVRTIDEYGKPISYESQQEASDTLASCRFDITKLLIYLKNNPDLWINSDIADGVLLAFDIHLPGWKQFPPINEENPLEIINLNRELYNTGNLYNIQEMTPNKYGLLGLNKPKEVSMKIFQQKPQNVAKKRSLHLTIRDGRNCNLSNQSKIKDLNIHELTHTICNDVEWKEDNHLPPYEKYHRFMRKMSRNIGIM